MLAHRLRWINIKAILVSRPVIAVDAGVEENVRSASVEVVLSQRCTQLTGIKPAMGCDSGLPLNRDWVGIRLHRVYRSDTRTRFTGKYRMEAGQNRRWWWNEYTLKIYILTFLLVPFLNYILNYIRNMRTDILANGFNI